MNLGRLFLSTLAFAIAKSVFVIFRLGFDDYPPALLPYDWLLISLLLLPGTLVYLSLLELLPPAWPTAVRRVCSAALSPVVAGYLWTFYGRPPAELWVLAFVVPVIYSLVVRLRPAAD